ELVDGAPAGAGSDGVPPPVSVCETGSTYAVAVTVPMSSFVTGVEPLVPVSVGASFTLWIVSRRPLTWRPPEEVRNVKWLRALKRPERSLKVPLKTNVNGICVKPVTVVGDAPDAPEDGEELDGPVLLA